jgi:pimeloyl-ACP methyl ester carboxylesterase
LRRLLKHVVVVLAIAACSIGAAFAQSALPRRADAIDETYTGHKVVYDSITDAHGQRVRLIVTHPDRSGQAAVIFVAGWLSCDSVEAPEGTREATSLVFRRLAALPDFALVRMEKPGVGDSEGDCSKTDFASEIADYRAAFLHMLDYGFVDADRIFVLGISNGGGFAPLVSGNVPIAGYVIDGGWLKTWFEHMLEIKRRQLTLSGKTPAEVSASMPDIARLYSRYLVEGTAPREIFKAEPSLARFWDDPDPDHEYGRPVVYYQQLEALNLAGAWSGIRCPALLLHGQFDWIMSAEDMRDMAAMIEKNNPGAARYAELAGAGHTFEHFATQTDAFAGRELPFDPKLADTIADWLESQLKASKTALPRH